MLTKLFDEITYVEPTKAEEHDALKLKHQAFMDVHRKAHRQIYTVAYVERIINAAVAIAEDICD